MPQCISKTNLFTKFVNFPLLINTYTIDNKIVNLNFATTSNFYFHNGITNSLSLTILFEIIILQNNSKICQ